jgi:hypothetical protein
VTPKQELVILRKFYHAVNAATCPNDCWDTNTMADALEEANAALLPQPYTYKVVRKIDVGCAYKLTIDVTRTSDGKRKRITMLGGFCDRDPVARALASEKEWK